MDLSKLEKIKQNHAQSGLFFDFDGVLSEIIEDYENAIIDDEIKILLEKVSKLYKLTAVISGRSVDYVAEKVGIEDLFYSGNHGIEFLHRGDYSCRVDKERYVSIFNEIEKKIQCNGVSIENKGVVMAFHYRKHPEIKEDLMLELEKYAHDYDLILKPGRMVFELKPKLDDMNKGHIVKEISENHGLKYVLYAGDDMTDLDVLPFLREMDGIFIGVYSNESPVEIKEKADICIGSVAEMRNILRYLSD